MAEEHLQSPAEPVPAPHTQPEELRREPRPAASVAQQEKPLVPKDSFREIVETVVFVIVLVLLLKTFVAEAFVIPTGSMAPTLYGNHLEITCPKCDYHYPVNASSEIENANALQQPLRECQCQNCGYVLKKQELDDTLGKAP